MRVTFSILVLICASLALAGCVAVIEQPAAVYAPPPPPPPPPPPVYYAPPPPPAPGIVIEGGGGPNQDHERAKKVQANCNTQWTGCVNVCNTLGNPSQKALCIANCNNAKNQCVRKNLGY